MTFSFASKSYLPLRHYLNCLIALHIKHAETAIAKKMISCPSAKMASAMGA